MIVFNTGVLLRRSLAARSFLILGMWGFTIMALAQNDEAPDRSKLDSLYAELDNLFAQEPIPEDLFLLADSILALEKIGFSSLNIRTSYIGQIQSAGRNFGVEQYGFNNGLTYLNKTGIYGNISSFIHSAYEPNYFLTTFSLGYMKNFWDKWNINASYDYFLYNDTLDFRPFSHSIQVSQFLELPKLDLGFDYSYLMGNESAHRLAFHLNGRFRWREVGFLDRITFMPGISVLYGNGNVYYWRQSQSPFQDVFEIFQSGDYPPLQRGDARRLTFLLHNENFNAANFILLRNGFTQEQASMFIEDFDARQIEVSNEFGLMNYSFTLPVILSKGRWSLMLAYTYNIPVALPKEDFEYPASGFFSASLSYTVIWSK